MGDATVWAATITNMMVPRPHIPKIAARTHTSNIHQHHVGILLAVFLVRSLPSFSRSGLVDVGVPSAKFHLKLLSRDSHGGAHKTTYT